MTTGIFAAADSDDKIAAFLSHRIAHLIAHHFEERLSGRLLGWVSLIPAIPWLASSHFLMRGASFASLGLATLYVALGAKLLLCSPRYHEPEADEIIALLMAQAGFDPRAALSVWGKLNQLEERGLGADTRFENGPWVLEHPHVRKFYHIRASLLTMTAPRKPWQLLVLLRPSGERST